MQRLVRDAQRNGRSITFVVIIPFWEQTDGWKLLKGMFVAGEKKRKSRFLYIYIYRKSLLELSQLNNMII